MLAAGNAASYKEHIVQRIVLKNLPDFDLLLQLEKDEPWPTFDDAQRRYASLKSSLKDQSGGVYLAFCDMLFMDEFAYGIAGQCYVLRNALLSKDAMSKSKLWKLKQSLHNFPTMLAMMPPALLQALREVSKPEKPDTWGLILLTQSHKIPCSVCKTFLNSEGSVRVRCLCCPFGHFAHDACVEKRKCSICSTPYQLTKLKGH